MKTVEEAANDWQELRRFRSLTELRDAVRNSASTTAQLRSVCWKAFLLFENLNWQQWPATISEARSTYTALRSHYLRAIHNPDEFDTGADPLSETEESPWVALRQDEALRAEIYQDVERCMPENMYFRQPDTQKILVDILFIYCKLNPDVGYRQGMHELLAPILWVVERDAVDANVGRSSSGSSSAQDSLMLSVLNHEFIEADAFTLYGLVMQNAKAFYDPGPSAPQLSATQPPGVTNDSPMLRKARKIFEGDLAQVDTDVYDHLLKLDIVPQIYLMRWVRLLFGREFPFDEVLIIWDLLFAEDPTLQLVDQICVAMLLRIRWQLLEADTNTAFTLLLRYPEPDVPPRTFVHDALRLRNNLTADIGGDIIARYSGQKPALVSRSPNRVHTPTTGRPVSPFRSPSRFQAASLESMLQNAAKDVMDKSRKLGLNKAVKDAVGEVRKNVQDFQSGWTSPRFSGRPTHSRVASEINDDRLIDKLMQRVTALEKRNRQLSQMLQNSVEDLWQCQAERAEKVNDDKESQKSLEALSSAIAKVQFVQVYLEDSSVPLPASEIESLVKVTSPLVGPENSALNGDASHQVPDPPTSPSPLPKDQETLSLPQPAIPTSTPDVVLPTSRSTNAQPTRAPVRNRPKLASSNFSWMLGQEEEAPSRTFVSVTSPHSAQPAEARRHNRANASLSGKGFLFGDDNEDSPFNEKPKSKNGKIKEDEEEVIDLASMGGSVG